MSELSNKWRLIINEWRASGESQKGYSRRVGISGSQLSYWFRRLEELDRKKMVPSGESKRQTEFIDLEPKVVEPRVLASAVELEFSSGMVLRIRG